MSVRKLEVKISVELLLVLYSLLPLLFVSGQNLIDDCAFLRDRFTFVERKLGVA